MPRRLYVTHQQSIARNALTLGSLGAARAALRALRDTDYDDEPRAAACLAALRDSRATGDESLAAIKTLIALEPAHGFTTPPPTLVSGSRTRGTRPE